MKRCVIVGGAGINNYDYIRSRLCADDYIVFCDSGLKHLESLQVKPGLIVGDFDSHDNPHLGVETIVLPCEKDDTDTVFAVKEAIKRGFDDFLLIGVVGARLDHTLGNVSILLYLDLLDKKGKIIDDYSEMEIVSNEPACVNDSFAYFSLLNISGTAKGITMNIIENSLVQNFGANQIKGTLLEGLNGTSVFRITKQEELTEQLNDRDIIIQHYLFKKVVFGIILFFLLFAPLAISAVINIEKFLEDLNIFYMVILSFCFLSIICYVVYNLVGLVYQNKKLKNK